MSKNTRNRILLTAVAALLLVTMAVGGTMAYLKAQTNPITNTFEKSSLGVTLDETVDNTFKMVPGFTDDKDPYAAITAGSEDAYLFVKITEVNNILDANVTPKTKYVQYNIAEGWTVLPGSETDTGKVIYRIVEAGDTTPYGILADDKVTYNSEVNETQMNALTEATYPKLTFQAYAVQYYATNDTEMPVADAWALTGN